MNKLYSYWDIEKACLRDIKFMFLLEEATAPDYATFARFRSLHFATCAEQIFRLNNWNTLGYRICLHN
ncbi:transposase [Clostridium saccharoperbutylacetonicum]|jgi:hypothetical protein|uniref:Transposase n=1 Tax=Clostridium saccharoperbutylacetonicum N1-4(HMT) TaxID=931276 RepID=M1MYS2_9CLOT|nr:transposase [Clostridium saccharoperbutylacetonicum N1-4(HMT)]NRT64599.1 transposase [Clostridium saccharoperbutylacetonicum]NSB28967.1 transposase [Clostridium saccharoperbutylacetonicum]NSB46181.1 transposase [Clostridium saccharoperbutylacetonicum]